ncbi:gliding motility protein GldL [Flavobacterium kingsejongi]|uniref:Gliding motility protein GldL n=1 Tax=Flavobacterium kingsejongi TaxID=1678728 RepID=A0A2S1LJ64_9FLAO|nr:gliding motility protein GldL [Flavobacterium kingsejongi]AWG23825.1 gliding motility protein GldL [Flavobacterium kingsejongi]
MAILSKKATNVLYGLGASVVIIGALFKLMHWPFASEMLIVGLGTEALIFFISAFEPVDEELDWSLVYPELAGGDAKKKDAKKLVEATETQGLLSQKLDNLLKEAKIDGALMSSLGNSIKNFESAAKGIAPTVDSIASTKKYSEELSLAAAQMESLNGLYKVQLESANRNAEANKEIADNAVKLKQEMQSMTSNIASLNNVYGGMLSAMSNKG